jgi:hypothetical protein
MENRSLQELDNEQLKAEIKHAESIISNLNKELDKEKKILHDLEVEKFRRSMPVPVGGKFNLKGKTGIVIGNTTSGVIVKYYLKGGNLSEKRTKLWSWDMREMVAIKE